VLGTTTQNISSKKQGLIVGKRGIFSNGKIPFRINKARYSISPIFIDPLDLKDPDKLKELAQRPRRIRLSKAGEVVFEASFQEKPEILKLKNTEWAHDIQQASLLYDNHLQSLIEAKEAEEFKKQEAKRKKEQLKVDRKEAQKLRDFGEEHNKRLARQQDIIDKYEHLTSSIKQIVRGLFKLGYFLFCLSVVVGIIIFTRWWSIILLMIGLPLLVKGGEALFPKNQDEQ